MKKTSILLWLSAVVLLGGCHSLLKSTVGKRLFWNFETEQAGSIPSGWLAAQSDGRYPSAVWGVQADSWGRALALSSSTNTGTTRNLLLSTGSSTANLRLSAKIRPISGKESQRAGILWRAVNQDSYYLACWDPLDNAIQVGYVEMGRMTLLRSAIVQADAASWHTLEIEHFRDTITVFIDNVGRIELQDDTLRYPGMIGLWTQADACAMFDDVRVEELR